MPSLSINGYWNVLLPSGASPWNSIFGPGRRSKYNTNHISECSKLTEKKYKSRRNLQGSDFLYL